MLHSDAKRDRTYDQLSRAHVHRDASSMRALQEPMRAGKIVYKYELWSPPPLAFEQRARADFDLRREG